MNLIINELVLNGLIVIYFMATTPPGQTFNKSDAAINNKSLTFRK